MNQTRRAGRSARCLLHTHEGYTLIKNIAEASDDVMSLCRDIAAQSCEETKYEGQWFEMLIEGTPNYRSILDDIDYVEESTCCIINYVTKEVELCINKQSLSNMMITLNRTCRVFLYLVANYLHEINKEAEINENKIRKTKALLYTLLIIHSIIFTSFRRGGQVDCSLTYEDKDFLQCRLVDQRLDETVLVMMQSRVYDSGISNYIGGVGQKIELYGAYPTRAYYSSVKKYDKISIKEVADRIDYMITLINKVSDGFIEEAAEMEATHFKERESSYNGLWQQDLQLQALLLSKAAQPHQNNYSHVL
jgi:hypothetical protein